MLCSCHCAPGAQDLEDLRERLFKRVCTSPGVHWIPQEYAGFIWWTPCSVFLSVHTARQCICRLCTRALPTGLSCIAGTSLLITLPTQTKSAICATHCAYTRLGQTVTSCIPDVLLVCCSGVLCSFVSISCVGSRMRYYNLLVCAVFSGRAI